MKPMLGVRWGAPPWLVVLLLLIGATRSLAEEGAAWRRTPYAMRASIAFEADAAFPPAFSERLRETVEQFLAAEHGASWSLQVEPPDESDPATVAELGGLEDALDRFQDTIEDQRFWLVVRRVGGRYQLQSRFWQSALRRLSPKSEAETSDRRLLPAEIARAISRQFRPILRIAAVQPSGVELELRAGDWANASQVAKGMVLQPFYRHLDKQGAVKSIQFLPWTYLTVDEVAGAEVKATLATGVRTSLGTGRRKNVELLAVVLRPELPSTTVLLHPRGAPSRPLVAHPVVVAPRPILGPESNEPANDSAPRARLLSDRHGQVVVPANEAHPLAWLHVFSGGQLLARVPYVPGSALSATLELPDDSLRLSVEGDLELLKGRLVDAVARRATLIARIRRMARQNDWKSVDLLLVELEKLPAVKAFDAEINAIRSPALETAQRTKDRVAEARIRQLAADAHELVVRYLQDEKLTALKEELTELRAIEKAEAAPPMK